MEGFPFTCSLKQNPHQHRRVYRRKLIAKDILHSHHNSQSAMATRFGSRSNETLIANQLLCSEDLKLAMDKTILSEEDGNRLVEFVSACRNLETLVFPNLLRSQRATFARRVQSLPLRSISFNSNSMDLGEVCPMLNQPFRRVSLHSQILTPNDTTQLCRIISKGTVDSLNMIDCTFEDMETLARGLRASNVSKILIASPSFQNVSYILNIGVNDHINNFLLGYRKLL